MRPLFHGFRKGSWILTRMHFLVPLSDARNDVSVRERAHLCVP